MDTIIERPHAKISPSSWDRVDHCTMSVRLTAAAPPSVDTIDSAAGTVAHDILERCLREGLDVYEVKRGSVLVKGHEVVVGGTMLDGVQMALDWVREHMEPPWLLEERLELPFAVECLGEPVWGYVDVSCERPVVTVFDYKNGHNRVAADAPQLKLYLLMLLLKLGRTGAAQELAGRTVACQPHAGGISVAELSWAEVEGFAKRVAHVLRMIRHGDLSYSDGPWCRFCPAAAFCPHLGAVAADSALARITPSPEMVASGEWTAERLNEAKNLADRLDGWIRAVDRVAEDYMLHGGKLKDWKLVRKRTTRRWIEADELKAAAALEALGVDPWDRKIVTPAEAERRAIPARREAVGRLAETPVGGLTVAPVDDKKPGVDVIETLQAAGRSLQASGFLSSATNRLAKPAGTG